MSIFQALDISASGLYAGRVRMEVIANNIANVESGGEGGSPYRRQEVVLVSRPWTPTRGAGASGESGGVGVAAIRQDASPPEMIYRPDDPTANAQGYVQLPNVNLPLEMVDMVVATRAYQANAAALKVARDMDRQTLDIMR